MASLSRFAWLSVAAEFRVSLSGQSSCFLVAERHGYRALRFLYSPVLLRLYDAAGFISRLGPAALLPDTVPAHFEYGYRYLLKPNRELGSAGGTLITSTLGLHTRRSGSAFTGAWGAPPRYFRRLEKAMKDLKGEKEENLWLAF